MTCSNYTETNSRFDECARRHDRACDSIPLDMNTTCAKAHFARRARSVTWVSNMQRENRAQRQIRGGWKTRSPDGFAGRDSEAGAASRTGVQASTTQTSWEVEHGTLPYPHGAGQVGGHSQGPSLAGMPRDESPPAAESIGPSARQSMQQDASSTSRLRHVSARHGRTDVGNPMPTNASSAKRCLIWR